MEGEGARIRQEEGGGRESGVEGLGERVKLWGREGVEGGGGMGRAMRVEARQGC